MSIENPQFDPRENLKKLREAWGDAFKRLTDSEARALTEVTSTDKIDEVDNFLRENESRLSEEAKYFLRCSIEVKRAKAANPDIFYEDDK